ncbi:MAG TPA: hypothetical protein VE082_07860, partial [Desulfobaccales bacterium]|nr:hypothetical protein [Desulfobaccales bacterium]
PALVMTIYYAFRWAVIAINALFNQSLSGGWPTLYAITFILISAGLYKMRRDAAVTGFMVYSTEFVLGLILNWGISETITNIFFLLVFLLAISGTFGFARLSQTK